MKDGTRHLLMDPYRAFEEPRDNGAKYKKRTLFILNLIKLRIGF